MKTLLSYVWKLCESEHIVNLLILLKKHALKLDTMELLKTGCQYDLLASPSSAGGVSVLHVKLTDAALKAIEEYYEWTRRSKVILL